MLERWIAPARVGNSTVDLVEKIVAALTKGDDGKPIGGVDFDFVTNSILLSDFPQTLDEIQRLIEIADVPPPGDPERLRRAEEELRTAEGLLKRLRELLAAARKGLGAESRQAGGDLEEQLRRRREELEREYYEKVRRSRDEAPEGPGKERGGR